LGLLCVRTNRPPARKSIVQTTAVEGNVRDAMKLAACAVRMLLKVPSLSMRTIGRRRLLPFAQGFACSSAGFPQFPLDPSFCCPCAGSAFSSSRLTLGHGHNTRILELRAFRDACTRLLHSSPLPARAKVYLAYSPCYFATNCLDYASNQAKSLFPPGYSS
jgi:hypothetical protein